MLEASISTEAMNYKGYLVRIWRSSAQSPWRASTRNTKTGEMHQFSSLETLFLFLREETTDHQETKL